MGALPPMTEGLIATEVLAELRARQQAEGPRPTAAGTRGRGSQAFQCARKVAFDVMGVPRDIEDSDWNLITFQIGHDAHDRIQRAFIKTRKARIEVPITHQPAYDVSGHADLVYDTHPLTGETRPNLITGEIKSMAQFGFDLATGNSNSRRESPGPKAEHIAQAAMYGLSPQLQSEFVHMIYWSKGRGDIAEWILGMDEELPHLDGRTPREIGIAELERLTKIFATVDAGNIPAREIPGFGLVVVPPEPDSKNDPWNCRYCAWQPTCAGLVAAELPAATIVDAAPTLTVGGMRQLPVRDALRERIVALSPDAQETLKESWGDLPSLRKPERWTDELLARVDGMILMLEAISWADAMPPAHAMTTTPSPAPSAKAEERGNIAPERRVHPDSLDDLRSTLTGFPADIRENFERQASAAGVPHLDHPNRWTVDHAGTVAKLLDVARDLWTTRIKAVHAACAEVELDDDGRHALIAAVTAGTTSSSRGVTAEQADRARDMCRSILAGHTVLELVDGNYRFTPVIDPDWRVGCKDAQVSQRALLDEAKRLAGEHGIEAPKKIDAIPGVLRVELEAWLTGRRAAA